MSDETSPDERNPGWIDAVSEGIGRLVSWLTLAMVLITFAVVVARYVFEAGSIAVQESITYLHATVFLLGAAFSLKHEQHVRVDIFYKEMSERRRAWVDVLGVLFLLIPTCGFVFLISLDYVGSAWSIRESSREAGGLPLVYVLKTLIPVFALLLTVQGIALMLSRIRLLRKPAA